MLGKGLHKPLDPTQTMEQAERVYRTVILAGLLHDIGKCFERGDFGAVKVTGKHPQVGADYMLGPATAILTGVLTPCSCTRRYSVTMKAVNFRMRCVWSLDAGSYTWFGSVASLHLVQ